MNITNCGRIVVDKVDNVSGDLIAGATFSVTPGQVVNGVQHSSSSLTEVANGVFCIDNMLKGQTYTVKEETPPPGHDLPATTTQQVSVSNTSSCSSVGSSTSADLTFRDPPLVGAIEVDKTAKDHRAASGSSPLAGAVFEVLDSQGNVVGSTQTTGADGTTCFSGLPLGTYTVRETAAPSGYKKAGDSTAHVTASGDCRSGAVTVPVVDTPAVQDRGDLHLEAGSGVTTGEITCTGLTADSGGTAEDKSFADPVPGTYNCRVIIDP